MNRPLIIGLMTEGSTDIRFLNNVITRTFEALIINESEALPDIYDIEIIRPSGDTFIQKALVASKKAEEAGVMILCIHADADDRSDATTFQNKMNPASVKIHQIADGVCKTIVPVVPIHMTEAWMHADLDLLKAEIMTDKSNTTLKLTRQPEAYADPKDAIEKAIHIAQEGVAKRRKRYELSMGDLYQPIGQKISLNLLMQLSSYQKFAASARQALHDLHYL